MTSNRNEVSQHEGSSCAGRSRFRQAGAAAMIALTAVVAGSIQTAEAQQGGVKPYTIKRTRDMRYCEVLVVKEGGVEVYNTTGLNDCAAEVWDKLDLEKIKTDFGAKAVQMNGPHFWMMDSQTLSLGEKVSLAGLEARYAATLDPAIVQQAAKGAVPYKVFTPKKTQKQVYAKGKAVFELVDAEGHIYVLQPRNEEYPIESLATLGEKMKQLPAGWKYRSRVLTKNLVLDLGPGQTIYAVGDEFHQYYTRPPKAK